jgi:hypothetical protein
MVRVYMTQMRSLHRFPPHTGLDETDITSMLPTTLRQQLSLFCNQRIINTVPLFANVPSHVSAAIVAQLQPRIFVPDDIIIRRA